MYLLYEHLTVLIMVEKFNNDAAQRQRNNSKVEKFNKLKQLKMEHLRSIFLLIVGENKFEMFAKILIHKLNIFQSLSHFSYAHSSDCNFHH